jgi:ribonuclease HI
MTKKILKTMKIFTDGSKITNEEEKEIAAYAVYNFTTKKEELERINRKQNNFRAELIAIMRAIQLTKKNQKITIITDSMSSIQYIESRIIENQEPGRSLDKNKIINGDILKTIKDEIYDRGEELIKFQWIEAYTNIQTGDYFYNNIADTLAKKAIYLDDNQYLIIKRKTDNRVKILHNKIELEGDINQIMRALEDEAQIKEWENKTS